MTGTAGTVEANTVFEMLANDHRRHLLFTLLEHNPRQEVQEPDGVSLDGIEREQVQVEMYHMHLPKLEEVGFIRWDRDAQEVQKGPAFEEIRPLLEVLHENATKILREQSPTITSTEVTED